MDNYRALLIARLAATRARLLWQLIGLDQTTLQESAVTGQWTAKDLLAHLADYDSLYGQAARQALDGRLGATGIDYTDVQNARLRERVQAWTLDQALAYFTQARAAFLEVLSQATEADLTRRHRFTWRAGQNEGQSQGSIKSWTQLGLPLPKGLLHFKGHYT
jgi:hypothetical protein